MCKKPNFQKRNITLLLHNFIYQTNNNVQCISSKSSTFCIISNFPKQVSYTAKAQKRNKLGHHKRLIHWFRWQHRRRCSTNPRLQFGFAFYCRDMLLGKEKGTLASIAGIDDFIVAKDYRKYNVRVSFNCINKQ